MRYLFLVLLTSFSFSQNKQKVDFKKVHGAITINTKSKTVTGDVQYAFDVNQLVDTVKIDAVNTNFTNVKINNKSVRFKVSTKQLLLFEGFKKGKNQLTFTYSATPKQTLYFVSNQIWTQGQGKYTSHWFPSFDDMNEKVIFDLSVTYDKNYEVIANGVLDKTTENNNLKTWHYKMQEPMSSYLLMIAIGKWDKRTQQSASGIPIVLYYQPEDANKFEPTYRYSKPIFDFFEQEIGVGYPWKVYKQVPVLDFLYAGMENTSATIFSQDFVVDTIGFNDRSYTKVDAHELAHQWFGDMVTAKSGKDHWLQEGFATYYALLAEKHLFGEDHFYWKMYEMAERLQQAAKTDTIPVLNEKASSQTFYQKGAWALYIIHQSIGNINFKKAVKNYLEKYKFQNVTTDDFLTEVNKVSDFDTATFKKKWLETSGFEVNEALTLLKKNECIRQYFAIAELKDVPFTDKKDKFLSVLKSNVFYPVKEEIVYQLQNVPFDEKKEVLQAAMDTKDLQVRQAIVQNGFDLPAAFLPQLQSLLDDPSYIAQEMAMNVIWRKYPEEQVPLLEKTKDRIGFNDKNLRILWLALALRTKDFQPMRKIDFYNELLDYASSKYESSIRQNALNNLISLDKNDQNYLPFLVNALTSHKWQFSKFGRDKIRPLLKNKNHRAYFETLLPQLSASEQIQLNKLLKEL
ncbi:MAG TPA: M1 family metallopeptidase [Flavobacterium sp.]|jgi:aminopeptidase N